MLGVSFSAQHLEDTGLTILNYNLDTLDTLGILTSVFVLWPRLFFLRCAMWPEPGHTN